MGVQHTRAHNDPRGADAYRTANSLARWYGPVFAETTPLNEAAVLYSLAQDVTETRNMLGTPHWERVYALVGAGLMAGVPMSVTYEEDVASGWLIEGGKPRVGMLFLVGQTKPLPAKVLSALDAFRAAGGKVFVDADSTELPGATRLPIKTGTLAEALHDGFGADSSFPLLFPRFEAMARSLAEAVGPLRRYPLDADDPWVSKNVLDGGEVRYLMAASETSPYPWSHEALWSLGAFYNRSYLPKMVKLSFPAAPGVVYDVFDRTVVTPEVKGQRATVRADLTTFPGRLFAIAPRKLGPPKVEAGVEEGTLHYRVEAVGEDGKTLAARVPLRIRLAHGETVVEDLARGTGANGVFNGELALPATAAGWTLEVTELLGGRGTSADISTDEGLGHVLTARADVETQRGAQIRELLPAAGGMITLLMSRENIIKDAQRMTLFRALQRHGVFLRIGRSLDSEVKPGVYLAVGHVPSLDVANPPNDLLGLAWRQGLYGVAVSTNVPGPGRGLITAVFAPRGDQEHAIVLLGGDDVGLAKTVRAFVSWLDHLPPRVDADQAVSTARTEPTPARPMPIVGRPAEIAPLPRLRDLVGAKLAGVTVGGDGVHLLVSGAGYLRNLALVADRGDRGELVRAERVGQAPSVSSPYLSDDGRSFGASAREVSRIGQGFHLIDARTGKQDVFAGFGDMGAKTHRFATNASGDVVVAARVARGCLLAARRRGSVEGSVGDRRVEAVPEARLARLGQRRAHPGLSCLHSPRRRPRADPRRGTDEQRLDHAREHGRGEPVRGPPHRRQGALAVRRADPTHPPLPDAPDQPRRFTGPPPGHDGKLGPGDVPVLLARRRQGGGLLGHAERALHPGRGRRHRLGRRRAQERPAGGPAA